METINHTLFLWLNAPAHPDRLVLAVATFLAEYAIWAIPAVIFIGWLRGSEPIRKAALEATVAGLAGLLINQIIGGLWQHPRPFMIGLGHNFLSHAPDSSFPSDHLTLLWSVAFSLVTQVTQRSLRAAGTALALLGLPVAWARIYLGVHFPLDMAGAAAVAVLIAWLARQTEGLYVPPAYRLASRIHCLLFGRLIERGWVRGTH